MPYWTIKKETDNEEIANPLIIFVSDDDKDNIETMFDASENYLDVLEQGVQANEQELNVIEYLSNIYGVTTAVDFVTAIRFKDKQDITDAQFMLAPSVDDVRNEINSLDLNDIKDILSIKGLSGRQFSKKIQVSERTMRDKLNEFKTKSHLSFAEKYLAKIIFYK